MKIEIIYCEVRNFTKNNFTKGNLQVKRVKRFAFKCNVVVLGKMRNRAISTFGESPDLGALQIARFGNET